MDSTSEGHGPKPDNNNNVAIFYIVYFVVFPFFFLNLFVGLIVVTFQEQGEAELQNLDLDKNQVTRPVNLPYKYAIVLYRSLIYIYRELLRV